VCSTDTMAVISTMADRPATRAPRWRGAPRILLLLPAAAITASLPVACLIILRFSFNVWSAAGGMVSAWTLAN